MLSSASPPLVWWPRTTSRPGSAKGSAFSITPWTTLKMAVLAPMASAMVPMHTAAKPGLRHSRRITERRSWAKARIMLRVSCRSSAIQVVLVGPSRRRDAAFAPGEAEQRGQLTRRQPGHGQPPAKATCLVELLIEHVGQLGAEPGPRGRGQQPLRGGVEAEGEPGHGQVRRGVSRFCRAILTARSSRAASARATASPAGSRW